MDQKLINKITYAAVTALAMMVSSISVSFLGKDNIVETIANAVIEAQSQAHSCEIEQPKQR